MSSAELHNEGSSNHLMAPLGEATSFSNALGNKSTTDRPLVGAELPCSVLHQLSVIKL